jgi:hypothetical protein
MKSKMLKYSIAALSLVILIGANLAKPIAFADTGDRSFNGQTVPTRTPVGGKPTSTPNEPVNTPKPPKESTSTPVPPPPAVGATFTPAPILPTTAPSSTNTPAPTALATSNAAQPTVTTASSVGGTSAPGTTAAPNANNPTATSTSVTGPIAPQVAPTIATDSNANGSPSFLLIGGGIVLLLVGLFFVFGRSKSNDQTKPQ